MAAFYCDDINYKIQLQNDIQVRYCSPMMRIQNIMYMNRRSDVNTVQIMIINQNFLKNIDLCNEKMFDCNTVNNSKLYHGKSIDFNIEIAKCYNDSNDKKICNLLLLLLTINQRVMVYLAPKWS